MNSKENLWTSKDWRQKVCLLTSWETHTHTHTHTHITFTGTKLTQTSGSSPEIIETKDNGENWEERKKDDFVITIISFFCLLYKTSKKYACESISLPYQGYPCSPFEPWSNCLKLLG